MLFLLRLKVWKNWLSPAPKKCGPTWRPTSPPSLWFSILIDLGAEVGEVRGAERAGAVLLDGEDAQARRGSAGSGISGDGLVEVGEAHAQVDSGRGAAGRLTQFVRTI